jgi:hypothetical protein
MLLVKVGGDLAAGEPNLRCCFRDHLIRAGTYRREAANAAIETRTPLLHFQNTG